MMTSGDPGRRCYPLALLMAAALTAGDSAERAVIGRVANASLMPDDADARALLLALDELQTTAFDDIGQPRGTQDLHSVTQTLEGKAAPAVLLLDTGNHALLVAKVILADATVYRVYDPNFALYGFTSVEQLQQGMQASLGANQNEIARLYGLADASNPSFNVIELNTTAIAEKVLSSNLRVDRFLQSTPPRTCKPRPCGRSRLSHGRARLTVTRGWARAWRNWMRAIGPASLIRPPGNCAANTPSGRNICLCLRPSRLQMMAATA